MHQIDDLFEERKIVHTVFGGILNAAVEVDRKYALGAGRHASRTQRIAEPVVLYLVTQAAA